MYQIKFGSYQVELRQFEFEELTDYGSSWGSDFGFFYLKSSLNLRSSQIGLGSDQFDLQK